MMNYLKGHSVYLSGPIENSDDPSSWRNQLTIKLEQLGLVVYNPLVKPPWMPPIDGPTQASWKSGYIQDQKIIDKNNFIRDYCIALTRSADIFVIYVDKKTFTIGTYEELSIASSLNKPILVLYKNAHNHAENDTVPSMWLFSQIGSDYGVFFNNVDGIYDYLNHVNNHVENLDPLKWIFLRHNK